MEDKQINLEIRRDSCQPPLPSMAEYMARNEYWWEEPEVVGELFRLAQSGEAWAQYSAGKLCYEGIIVPLDEEGAQKWWRRAAKQGHPMAQRWLGEFYASRQIRGIEANAAGQNAIDRNIMCAKIWLGRAAQQGVVDAMGMLGSLESIRSEANRCYCMGAEHGDVDCMYVLGEVYTEGSRIAHADKAFRLATDRGLKAEKWFRLAADRGHKGAPFILGHIYEEGTVVVQNLSEAARYYRMGAEQGHNGCRYLLGRMLVEGRGIPVDHEEADHWLQRVHLDVRDAWELRKKIGVIDRQLRDYDDRKLAECAERIERLMPAAEKGDASVQFELGEIYRQHDVRKQAVEWHWKAASQGHDASKSALLDIFIDCWYNNSCFDEVKKWIRELAHSGNPRAQYLMAHCEDRYSEDGNYSQIYKYWLSKSAAQGYSVAQYEYADARGRDDDETFDLYHKAALSGHLAAQIQVARCYSKGIGTTVNVDAALEWAIRAVKGAKDKLGYDYVAAQTLLGNIYEAQNTAKGDMAAIACYVDVASRYSPEANFALGKMYEVGRGVEQDHAKAVRHYMEALSYELGLERNRENSFLQLFRSIKWHSDIQLEICKQAAEGGNSSSQVEYGIRIYEWGRWDPDNDAEVARWFKLSADQGNPVGQYCLGRVICSTSRSWSHPVAMQMFRNAARSGLAEAQTAIAQYYRERSDYAVAVRWYRMAAEQGEYAALVAMGEMNFRGEGMPKDDVIAARWLRKALEWDEGEWVKRTWALLK